MLTGITTPPHPYNEPVLTYVKGSLERAQLLEQIKVLSEKTHSFTLTIGGVQRMGGGVPMQVVQPHDHKKVLGVLHNATQQDAKDAVVAAQDAAAGWQSLPFDERAAVFLRAADLLCGPWRAVLNAATMLGQSKTIQQAEIDAIAEMADFWRFNVSFAQQILAQQPINVVGQWNRLDYRSLDGFVYAVTPFNFTAIAGNLPTGPALMGNTVVWKVAPSQSLSAHLTMRLLEAAGLPPGVINLLTGDGKAVSEVVLGHSKLAGIHFTGSTGTFRYLWQQVGANITNYESYPRIVGETGGKDYLLAHPSAQVDSLVTAMIRGAFEYQGQKCSALSRVYVAGSVWEECKPVLVEKVQGLRIGSPVDFENFAAALIDRKAFDKVVAVIERAKVDPVCNIIVGGVYDDSVGYFVSPTVIECTDPGHELFSVEFFGPILAVYVYVDEDYESMFGLIESSSVYALTGAVHAKDRNIICQATERLRFTAGNFYINDRPTGSVVGQQPFGGSKASGTNDKAGSAANLLRWVSVRTIKENFVPPTEHVYLHQG